MKKKKIVDSIYAQTAELANIMKKQGAEASIGTEDTSIDASLWIPTGSTLLDGLLTHSFDNTRRGIPIGRVVDFIGPPGAGKSTILAHILSECQKAGGISVLLASEGERCKERMDIIGVDPRGVIIVLVKDILHGFYWITSLVNKKQTETPMIIGWDTMSAAPSPAEASLSTHDTVDKIKAAVESNKAGLCARARIIREQIRITTNLLHQKKTTLIAVHQTIEKPQMAKSWLDYQPQSSGGRAVPFQSSMRLYIAGGDKWKEKNQTIGINTRVKPFKSKLVPPEREVRIPMRFRTGIDDAAGCLRFLTKCENPLVTIAGGWTKIKVKDGRTKSMHDGSEIDPETLSYMKAQVLGKLDPTK